LTFQPFGFLLRGFIFIKRKGNGVKFLFLTNRLTSLIKADPKMTRKKLLKVMDGNILEQAQLVGLYSKRKIRSE